MKPVDVFELFTGSLHAFSEAVAQAEFACWVGSGVSRNRVPTLPDLLLRTLEHLRVRFVSGDGDHFRVAIERIIDFAILAPESREQIDLTQPVGSWPCIDLIIPQLTKQYSTVLDVQVEGEEPDYLLWKAVDARATYGDKTLEPDIEHIALGVLVLEGVAPIIVTTNWDGLIESAIERLTGRSADTVLHVIVHAEDLRGRAASTDLYKFHGCAVLAAKDPARYRGALVARESQISGWGGNDENKAMLARLVEIAAIKKTLLMGLSASDVNIKLVFSKSESHLRWPWPSDPSACMIAAPALGIDHESVLKNFYRKAFQVGCGDQIQKASTIGAYPAPVLVALVIYVLYVKLALLLEDALRAYAPDEQNIVRTGLKALVVGALVQIGDATFEAFADALVVHSHFSSIYLSGIQQLDRYHSIGSVPIHQIIDDQFVKTVNLAALSVVLSILGLGHSRRLWTLSVPEVGDSRAPSMIASAGLNATTRVFIVCGAEQGLKLLQSGRVTEDDADAIILYAGIMAPPVARSSAPIYGRTNKATLRTMSIEDLINGDTTAEGLLDRFRRSAVI